MKAKVKQRFRDKETGEVREVGSTFECTDDRYNEILTVGDFVEKVKTRRTRKKADAAE